MSLLLLPYQLATRFCGMSSLGAAASVAAELEASVVDTVAWTNQEEEEETEDIEEIQLAVKVMAVNAMAVKQRTKRREELPPTAPGSNGKKKRLKHEAFLARTRTRAGKSCTCSGTSPSGTFPGTMTSRQAWYALPSSPQLQEDSTAVTTVTLERSASMRAVAALMDNRRLQAKQAGKIALRAQEQQHRLEQVNKFFTAQADEE